MPKTTRKTPVKAQTSVNSSGGGVAAAGDHNILVGQQGVNAGNVGGDIITGTVIVKNYLRRAGLVDQWPTEEEAAYLQRVQTEFLQSLSKNAASAIASADLITERYVPVLLNRRKTEAQGQSNRSGEWDELTTYPCIGLLIGDPYDGKSMLMRKVAHDLAKVATDMLVAGAAATKRPLPIFLPLNRYPFASGNPDELLNLAAYACGATPSEMQANWHAHKRHICLLIDGVDEIPEQNNERANFVQALTALTQNRVGKNGVTTHSLILACRPDNGPSALRTRLAEILGGQTDYVEWSVLPLTEAKIGKLLQLYGVPDELSATIKDDIKLDATNKAKQSKYWRLVNKPGLIATLGKATRGSGMSTPPRNTVELCELFIHRLVDQAENGLQQSDGKPFYHYAQAKKPALGRIAYRMLLSGQNSLLLDDELCRELAHDLETLAQNFSRIRRYLPDNWHIADFLQSLRQMPIANAEAAQNGYFEFASTLYRDYFAALHLAKISPELSQSDWQLLVDTIRKSGRERWEDALIFLSDMTTPLPTSAVNGGGREGGAAGKLMDAIFDGAAGSEAAADLWLEKGNRQTSRIPTGVANEFFRRRTIIEASSLSSPPLQALGMTRLARHDDPRVALQAVNLLTRFGLGAVSPLLDAVSYPDPFVSASAMHALFHLGPRMARTGIANADIATAAPLIDIDDAGLRFNNGGAGNASIGRCVLVDVPRTFQADMRANIAKLDFDPFASECSFELWHEPAAYFALNYFKQIQRVDWIGLATACDTVQRCATLLWQKASAQSQLPNLQFVAAELELCMLGYGRLGDRIATALKLLPDVGHGELGRSAWLLNYLADVDLAYDELRLLFDRINRSSNTAPKNIFSAVPIHKDVLAVDANATTPGQETALPDLHEFGFNENIASLADQTFVGINIGKLLPSSYRVAETLLLQGNLALGQCRNSTVAAITIAAANGWNGVRTTLTFNIEQLQNSDVRGIVVTPSG